MANTDKALSASARVSPSILHAIGKKATASVKAGPVVNKSVGKSISTSVKAGPVVNKSVGKKATASVSLSASIPTKTAVLTMVYNGNAELGLGAQEGAQFDIIVTGTFSVFSIAMNGRTLTYTENCVDQTITIDNVNATVKNGTTNKLTKVTGDVADFLKLLPGNNTITISKTGGSVDFVWDFRPQFI